MNNKYHEKQRLGLKWARLSVGAGLLLLLTFGVLAAISNTTNSGSKNVVMPAVAPTLAPNSNVASSVATASTSKATIREEQLITTQEGWVLTNQNLLWTSNAGKSWFDITPGQIAPKVIRGIYFVDSSKGWVVAFGQPLANIPDANSISTPLLILKTTDAGKTWVTSELAGPSVFYTDAATQPVAIDFVDTQHGWVMVQLATSSNFSRADLFGTSDGGVTRW